MEILTFTVDAGGTDDEPWFAIPVSKFKQKGTFKWLKEKFDHASFTWQDETFKFIWDKSGDQYVFTRYDYDWIKNFATDQNSTYQYLFSGKLDKMPSALEQDDLLGALSFTMMKFKLEMD